MAGIEKAQRRLRQARFFYQHLLNPRTSTKGNQEAFAFIQAARSVTWTLGNEEPDKWNKWKRSWKANPEERKLLKITTDLRNLDAKEGGVDLTMELEEVAVEALVEAIPSDRRLHTAFLQAQRRRLPGASTQKTIKVVLPVHYFEDEGEKKVVSDLCRRYLELLEKVVTDFCKDMKI